MQTAPAIPARFDQSTQHRRSMMAKIAIARKQLAMEEDDYRSGLFDATGRTSLRDCSDGQLERVLDWLKKKGFRAIPRKGAAQHPMALKARALWISLYQLGAVHNPAEAALEAFALRQLKCERLVWARQSDAFRLIEALKAMARRAGWIMHNPHTGKPLGPVELKSSLCQVILARAKDKGGVPADWGLHDAIARIPGVAPADGRAWTADDYDRLADALGRRLREVL